MIRDFMERLAVDRQPQMRGVSTGPAGMTVATRTERYGLNTRTLAGLVGIVAIGMPTALILYSMQSDTCMRDSISHYYYSPFFGTIFVVSLTLIAAFMIAYRGDSFWWETPAARFAGVMALCVAIFPTNGHGCAGAGVFDARPVLEFAVQPVPAPGSDATGLSTISLPEIGQTQIDAVFEIAPWTQYAHIGCAVALFAFLFVYALIVFPSTDPTEPRQKDGHKLSWYKTIRNIIYYITALAILTAIVKIGWQFFGPNPDPMWDINNRTFFWEAVALYAFGAGWILKGRFLGILPEE